MDTGKLCIIGVGNADCGDDGIGPVLIDQLQRGGDETIQFIKATGEPTGLIELLSGTDQVILIDALATQGREGTIHRFDASEEPLPAEFFTTYSTHSMGVNEAIEMARALGNLPSKTIVYGIEACHFEPGDSMSPAVQSQLPRLLQGIRKEISLLNA